jgi:alpha-tubulin suppressor-like RCC1 family protein
VTAKAGTACCLLALTALAAAACSRGIGRTQPSGVRAIGIAAGYAHTCALTRAGGVRCWGYNHFGQLGDGTTVNRRRPVGVFGLRRGVRAIAAGGRHSCALMKLGAVECWGDNAYGELGDGTTARRLKPVAVRGLHGLRAVAAGEAFACALTGSGRVACWGDNRRGELGDGTTRGRDLPAPVADLGPGVTAIALGYFHACALEGAGTVECWGYNGYGQLGDGTSTDRRVPVRVSGLTGVVEISAGGGHTCALTRGGTVRCWGSNRYGELGDETTTPSSTPVPVSGLVGGVRAIGVGGEAHGCAVTSGGVKCWGYNGHGQLGDGTTTDRVAPVDVVDLAGATAIATGGYGHSCALTRPGEVECWGRNSAGQLGDGATSDRQRPAPARR